MSDNDFILNEKSKIYVAGHNGLIGSAFCRRFEKNSYTRVVTASRSELDLTCKVSTSDFFRDHKPEVVILAAGKVGGIVANRDFPADFINENLSIQLNVLNAAHHNGVKRLIFFGSSCMYPRNSMQPMKEDYLFTGHLESTSIAYAMAKYAGLQMCLAFNKQYKNNHFISVIPNSVYGPNDNFDLNNSHVLSALIRKFHEAKEKNELSVTLWGTGMPRREFIYVDDVVDACVFLLRSNLNNIEFPINIGTGEDVTIQDLSQKIGDIMGYDGKTIWDHTKPDGASRKLLDSSQIKKLGWQSKVSLLNGLNLTIKKYQGMSGF